MVATGWKKALEKSGRSQRYLSNAIDVNLAEVSLAVQGRAFLMPSKFAKACEILQCKPSNIYTDDVLAFVYGGVEEKKKKVDTRVRLDEDVMELVEAVASHEHLTRTQAANTIIRRWGQE